MATTDRDVENKRNKAAKLREQIANEQAKRAEAARQAEIEVEAAQLDVEITRLEAQLDAEKAETAKQVAAKKTAGSEIREQADNASVTAVGPDTETKKEN